jgi:hypothetical protein
LFFPLGGKAWKFKLDPDFALKSIVAICARTQVFLFTDDGRKFSLSGGVGYFIYRFGGSQDGIRSRLAGIGNDHVIPGSRRRAAVIPHIYRKGTLFSTPLSISFV